MLIDKGMKRTELRDAVDMRTNTLAKLGKNDYISLEILDRICIPEFRKVIGLLAEVKAPEEIKKLRQGQRGFFSVISSFKMNWIRLGGISMTV